MAHLKKVYFKVLPDLERLLESAVKSWSPRQVHGVVGNVQDPEVSRRIGSARHVQVDRISREAHLILGKGIAY